MDQEDVVAPEDPVDQEALEVQVAWVDPVDQQRQNPAKPLHQQHLLNILQVGLHSLICREIRLHFSFLNFIRSTAVVEILSTNAGVMYMFLKYEKQLTR